jgi:hypothetical protein
MNFDTIICRQHRRPGRGGATSTSSDEVVSPAPSPPDVAGGADPGADLPGSAAAGAPVIQPAATPLPRPSTRLQHGIQSQKFIPMAQ